VQPKNKKDIKIDMNFKFRRKSKREASKIAKVKQFFREKVKNFKVPQFEVINNVLKVDSLCKAPEIDSKVLDEVEKNNNLLYIRGGGSIYIIDLNGEYFYKSK